MQHLRSYACISLIFSVMFIFRVNAFSFETVTNVTKDVIMKYNSICVYLMHSDHQSGGSVFYLILFLIFWPNVCYFVLICFARNLSKFLRIEKVGGISWKVRLLLCYIIHLYRNKILWIAAPSSQHYYCVIFSVYFKLTATDFSKLSNLQMLGILRRLFSIIWR